MRPFASLFPKIILGLGALPVASACGSRAALTTYDDVSEEDPETEGQDSGTVERRDASLTKDASAESWDRTQCGEGGKDVPLLHDCRPVVRQLPCDLEDTTTDEFLATPICDQHCPTFTIGHAECRIIGVDGGRGLECSLFCGGGRRPAGLREQDAHGDNAVGRFLAKMGELEAASVEAFEILNRELGFHGGPRRLMRRIEIASRDEKRHAKAMARLTLKYGGVPIDPVVDVPRNPRSLLQLALENAVEGCVRETYGALLAQHQAMHADDEDIRHALRVIARDEAKHAQTSWSIHEWAKSQLGSDERALVEKAMRAAIAKLYGEHVALDEQARTALGLPDEATHRALMDALASAVWTNDALHQAS